MEHQMILLDADFKTVCARIVARRKNASLAHREEQMTRNHQSAVRGCDEAPDLQEERE